MFKDYSPEISSAPQPPVPLNPLIPLSCSCGEQLIAAGLVEEVFARAGEVALYARYGSPAVYEPASAIIGLKERIATFGAYLPSEAPVAEIESLAESCKQACCAIAASRIDPSHMGKRAQARSHITALQRHVKQFLGF